MADRTLGLPELQSMQALTDAVREWTRGEGAPALNVLDCIVEAERLTFLVAKGQLGLAVGREAVNLKRLKTLLHKEVKVLEFDEDKTVFVTNLFKPYRPQTISVEQKKGGGPLVATVSLSEADKGKAIGKGGKNIQVVRALAKRHHDIEEVKVL